MLGDARFERGELSPKSGTILGRLQNISRKFHDSFREIYDSILSLHMCGCRTVER